MALMKCPECSKEISDLAEKCIHCGYPIQNRPVQGKAIFQTTHESIAILAKYIIKDESGTVVAKLKSSDSFEVNINCDTRFFIRLSGGFAAFKEVTAPAGQISKFKIGTSNGGISCYIERM